MDDELHLIHNKLTEMGITLARIDERQEAMHKTLFGNGQPGVIREMETTLTEHDKQLSVGRGVGIAAVFLMTLLEIILKFFVKN